jgi:hypothetical protein
VPKGNLVTSLKKEKPVQTQASDATLLLTPHLVCLERVLVDDSRFTSFLKPETWGYEGPGGGNEVSSSNHTLIPCWLTACCACMETGLQGG